ncbi:MAG: hypothetical protein QNJ72_29050 [Pleurocapsa sp. MO_226.B13]|nr:hypothetical protein [Pleurocapsa sp. MO_226.B13]
MCPSASFIIVNKDSFYCLLSILSQKVEELALDLSSLLVVVIFFVITDRWYIQLEEKAMAKTFGDQYAEYKAKTRRWL